MKKVFFVIAVIVLFISVSILIFLRFYPVGNIIKYQAEKYVPGLHIQNVKLLLWGSAPGLVINGVSLSDFKKETIAKVQNINIRVDGFFTLLWSYLFHRKGTIKEIQIRHFYVLLKRTKTGIITPITFQQKSTAYNKKNLKSERSIIISSILFDGKICLKDEVIGANFFLNDITGRIKNISYPPSKSSVLINIKSTIVPSHANIKITGYLSPLKPKGKINVEICKMFLPAVIKVVPYNNIPVIKDGVFSGVVNISVSGSRTVSSGILTIKNLITKPKGQKEIYVKNVILKFQNLVYPFSKKKTEFKLRIEAPFLRNLHAQGWATIYPLKLRTTFKISDFDVTHFRYLYASKVCIKKGSIFSNGRALVNKKNINISGFLLLHNFIFCGENFGTVTLKMVNRLLENQGDIVLPIKISGKIGSPEIRFAPILKQILCQVGKKTKKAISSTITSIPKKTKGIVNKLKQIFH